MMHLELQPGLIPDEFCKQARRFVDWFIELVERHMFYERRGWTAHLEAYDWKGRGWRETLRLREGWQEGLRWTRVSRGRWVRAVVVVGVGVMVVVGGAGRRVRAQRRLSL